MGQIAAPRNSANYRQRSYRRNHNGLNGADSVQVHTLHDLAIRDANSENHSNTNAAAGTVTVRPKFQSSKNHTVRSNLNNVAADEHLSNRLKWEFRAQLSQALTSNLCHSGGPHDLTSPETASLLWYLWNESAAARIFLRNILEMYSTHRLGGAYLKNDIMLDKSNDFDAILESLTPEERALNLSLIDNIGDIEMSQLSESQQQSPSSSSTHDCCNDTYPQIQTSTSSSTPQKVPGTESSKENIISEFLILPPQRLRQLRMNSIFDNAEKTQSEIGQLVDLLEVVVKTNKDRDEKIKNELLETKTNSSKSEQCQYQMQYQQYHSSDLQVTNFILPDGTVYAPPKQKKEKLGQIYQVVTQDNQIQKSNPGPIPTLSARELRAAAAERRMEKQFESTAAERRMEKQFESTNSKNCDSLSSTMESRRLSQSESEGVCPSKLSNFSLPQPIKIDETKGPGSDLHDFLRDFRSWKQEYDNKKSQRK